MGRNDRRATAGALGADPPPKAQAIIRAAQRILRRDGFAKLSFETIAAEAGVYTSAIRYYFGNKSGLVEALVDATTHDISRGVYNRSRGEPNIQMRVRRVILESTRLPLPAVYQTMWEMLPHILRSKALRRRVAGLYDVYRQHYYEAVLQDAHESLSPEAVRTYASLLIAVLDGIAIQKALDPDGVDVEAIFALWARILSDSLTPSVAPQDREAPGDSDSPG